MRDAAALRALLVQRLEPLRPKAIAALKTLPKDGYPEGLRLILEVQPDDLTEGFPVAPVVDAPAGTAAKWYRLQDLFKGLPAPLSQDDLDAFTVWEDGPVGPQHALEQPVLDGARLETEVLLPWITAIWAEAGLSNLPLHAEAGVHDRGARVPLTRRVTGQDRPRRLRNPLISREGPPVSLSVRAARWGALAVLLGGVILAVPVHRGWSDAQARLAADPSLCGVAPQDGTPGDDTPLHDRLVQFFIETCEVAK